MTGRRQIELPPRGAVQKPARQHAVFDEGARLARHALAIEGPRAHAAQARRIVDDANALGEDRLAHHGLEKAHAPRDGGAVDGARQMPEQPARHARVIDDGQSGAFQLARIEAPDRALAGLRADRARRVEVACMARARAFVIGLHGGAFARHHRAADAVRGSAMDAAEACAGCEHLCPRGPACACTVGIGDALDGARGVFGLPRQRRQALRRGLSPVFQIERGKRLGETV